MPVFSALVEGQTIRATSPDQRIVCELVNGTELALGFTADSYRQYVEPHLQRQLAGLATSMWARHRRAHLDALSERVGHPVGKDDTGKTQQQREFATKRAELVSEGVSPKGHIHIFTRGMVSWEVYVRPGALSDLDEDEFAREALDAFFALTEDFQFNIAKLRTAVYRTRVSNAPR